MHTASSRGVVTMATGGDEYLMLAGALLKSLRRHAASERVGLLTDRPDHPVAKRFDEVVEVDRARGAPFAQKLWLDDYACFEESMYVDADCLVYGDLDPLWQLFSPGGPVGVLARSTTAPYWCPDLSRLPARYRSGQYLEFNGGLYYLRRGAEAAEIFGEAREVFARSAEFGLLTYGTAPGDEPALGLTLSRRGYVPPDDAGRGMRTPSHVTGRARLDVLYGRASFVKYGEPVTPVVVHYAGGRWRRPTYRREVAALRLAGRGVPVPAARVATAARYDMIPLLRRTARRIARRPPVDELAPAPR